MEAENKNIVIKNIYYMLCYVFRNLHQLGLHRITSETFERDALLNLLTEILLLALHYQIKRGMWQNFERSSESLSTVRGKINLEKTIRHKIERKRLIYCTYDDFKADTPANQIIKTILEKLLRLDIDSNRKQKISRTLKYFGNVSITDLSKADWDLKFNTRLRYMQLALAMCRLIFYSRIMDPNMPIGKRIYRFVDERALQYIFEDFVREYFKVYQKDHPEAELKVDKGQHLIPWFHLRNIDRIPTMRVDVCMMSHHSTLFIDTKFYEKGKVLSGPNYHSTNLYQIFAYVINEFFEKNRFEAVLSSTHNGIYDLVTSQSLEFSAAQLSQKINTPLDQVSGLLLYAKTISDKPLNECFQLMGCNFMVKTLDLNVPFEEIKHQLNKIAEGFIKSSQ